MGRLIEHRESDDKWRVWSTISDIWMTDWLTLDEIKEYFSLDKLFQAKIDIIQIYWTFPNNYSSKDGKIISNNAVYRSFLDWQLDAIKSGNYGDMVDAKYKELTRGSLND